MQKIVESLSIIPSIGNKCSINSDILHEIEYVSKAEGPARLGLFILLKSRQCYLGVSNPSPTYTSIKTSVTISRKFQRSSSPLPPWVYDLESSFWATLAPAGGKALSPHHCLQEIQPINQELSSEELTYEVSEEVQGDIPAQLSTIYIPATSERTSLHRTPETKFSAQGDLFAPEGQRATSQ